MTLQSDSREGGSGWRDESTKEAADIFGVVDTEELKTLSLESFLMFLKDVFVHHMGFENMKFPHRQ